MTTQILDPSDAMTLGGPHLSPEGHSRAARDAAHNRAQLWFAEKRAMCRMADPRWHGDCDAARRDQALVRIIKHTIAQQARRA